jgi:putative transposase
MNIEAMEFQKDHIYHIYNQGNNRREIFFERENYLFFLKKIKTYVSPYVDILAWCLMPNHFHLMVLVRELSLKLPHSQGLTQNQALTMQKSNTPKERSLNESIGILLRSYTRAINKQQNLSGSLFRKNTKAECITCPEGIAPSWFMENGITTYINLLPEDDYPQVCFNYIHNNPVKAKLVQKAEDWEFSSAMDYAGIRSGHLINKKTAIEFGLTS